MPKPGKLRYPSIIENLNKAVETACFSELKRSRCREASPLMMWPKFEELARHRYKKRSKNAKLLAKVPNSKHLRLLTNKAFSNYPSTEKHIQPAVSQLAQ
ncbi:hypothetical protein [Nostoc sp. LEGE 12450]|uniref:hypothetical protein n=1 Tax=Nostoc sp. LEGE 12450 TaxID=1828643 RepID=UPI00187E6738|nr:hypothetical protein [Nostoc sp. LEGE 12450]MBE8990905.1 hypothetical protein [Nostoc sp. LEGE 12450]